MSLNSPKISRRNSAALKNVVVRRSSLNTVVNLNALVRVFFLDGSSKVLQMFENSTAADVMIALKFNLDLIDISTHALFRVFGVSIRRIDLSESISEVLKDHTDSGQEVRLLFRSWVTYKYGGFDQEVFQYGRRTKQPNTALWLTYLEASFMCNTEKLLLTEEESLVLGCLKMQAESGDFNPSVHNLEVIKNRVVARFPNPVRSKMKALSSSTVAGTGIWSDLASRVQQFYARVAGKSKVEAQIDFLSTLRTYCPFYGSTFFEVHCQYDENPLEQASSPPILAMTAAVGPLAIMLQTQTDQPVLMRHPYKRIIKWLTYQDKHIFTYWVIKPHISYHDLEEYQESNLEDFNAKKFCDCVYLVTAQVAELEYLVRSYVEALSNHPPALPGATGDLLPLEMSKQSASILLPSSENSEPQESSKSVINIDQPVKSKGGRFSTFFSALRINQSDGNSAVQTGSGLTDIEACDEIYGDDTVGVGKSMFQSVYKRGNTDNQRIISHQSDDELIPSSVQYAASMSELKRLAEAQGFSDSEEEEESDGEERERDQEELEASETEMPHCSDDVRCSDESLSEENNRDIVPQSKDSNSTLTAMRRASHLLFKPFEKSPKMKPSKV